MWQSDDDVLNDFDQLDEICSIVTQNDRSRKEFQDKQTGNIRKKHQEKRGRLYSSSDDEDEPGTESGFAVDNIDHFDMLKEVGRQITLATGNVHDNDITTEYWRNCQEENSTKKTVENGTKIEENGTKIEEERGRSLIFEPKFNFQQPKLENVPVPNTSPTKAKSKKKESVALAISNSLKSLKIENELKNAVNIEVNNEPKIEPKIEPNEIEKISETKENMLKINCRFSLPITRNTYKDFYTGRQIDPPVLKEDVNISNHGWNRDDISTWSDDFQPNFEETSDSSISSYITADSSSNHSEHSPQQYYSKKLTKKQNNKQIDVNSEIEFPPL